MLTVGIVANGPVNHIPDLKPYEKEVDMWIGADLGALTLVENGIPLRFAVGDFDSIHDAQRDKIAKNTTEFQVYPEEKGETDLEIAVRKAFEHQAGKIYLFGVTGGRLDHALINIQLLHKVLLQNIRGIIVDKWNELELTKPGTYTVSREAQYPYISFIPFTEHVSNLSLTGFYYPLDGYNISWGSTRCISNKLVSEEGVFTYEEGMLLLIKSSDAAFV